MKKRKTYEISVIDKTYSKTISDETKFYTSDTSLELVFKLKETEYIFESAEIVLLNIDDRSLVTRPVVKNLDSFTYELEDDITAHYGEWHGQLRFEQLGEIYVSSPIKFRIENDLSNERPPQLSDVQSWVSLKRYADGLVDELKQAVLSIEGIENTFNENETVRQSQFDNAEQSRQTTFETNESERNQTFESNELTRQTQELEREKAESQRQTVFDGNEANRNETFNANEATRQVNETTRQNAEGQRATAESSRVSAEEQRKVDHANRSAELAGKADKIILKNLLKNGNFSNGLADWQGMTTIYDGIISGGYRIYQSNTNALVNQGRKYYMFARVRSANEGATTSLCIGFNGAINVIETVKDTDWRTISIVTGSIGNGVFIITSNALARNINIDASFGCGIIDITQTFGAGNEPTKEEMDELIKVTGYIDGEYALNNKEMLIWTLALIRSNKNAIVTLGGTI